ncbi:putative E3 ubiquitin-protein ligase [Ceratocystis pirilliformis]|uniref:HECT-type E3 ubiquitin transferase n=1 Tax=Ceratocystis pirilliformis TaxID=259994 RepID=A0ABR3ZQ58_9PEZI
MAPWFRSRSAVRSRSDSNLSAHRSNNLPQQEFLPHLHPSTTANFFQDTLSISGSSATQIPTVLQPIIRQSRSHISQPCANGSGRFENGSQIRGATRMQAQGEIKSETKVQTQRHNQSQIQTPTYPQTQPQAQPQIQTHIQLSPTSSATPSTPSSTSEQYPPFQTRQRSIRFKPETFERGNPRQSRSRNHVRSQSHSTCYTPPASVSRTSTTASIDDTLASKSKVPTFYTTAYTTSTATVTTATTTTATPTPTSDMDHQRQQQPPPSSQRQNNLPSRPRSVSNPMDIFLSSLQPQPSSTPQRALSTNTRRHSGLRRAGAAVFAAARRRTGHHSDSDSDGEIMPTQEQTQAQIQAFLQLQPAQQPALAPQLAPQKAPQQPKGAGHSRGRSMGGLADRSNGPAWLADEEAYKMGPCMTCDAQMRWPREAEAFRCTGCLTINDVIPRKPQRIEPSASATTSSILLDRSHTESSLHKIPRKPVGSSDTPSKSKNIISIETTKTIIVECLEQFLFGVLFSGPANRTVQNGTSNGTSADNDFGTKPRSESRIEPKRIFRHLEDYIMNSFSKDQCVNSSFSSTSSTAQTPSPGVVPSAPGQATIKPQNLTGVKSPQIDWDGLLEWYNIVINVGENWQQIYSQLDGAADPSVVASINHVSLERQILQAQEHVQKALLKATEQLLKRPGRLLKSPDDIRFLLIIIENPLLGSDPACFQGVLQPDLAKNQHRRLSSRENRDGTIRPLIGYHSGIIKRIFGLLSNASPECHNYLRQWWARFSRDRFIWTKDMASRFLAYRLTRHREKHQRPPPPDPYSQLIPEIPSSSTAAQAHSAIESFMSAGDTHNNRDSRRDTKKNKTELHEIPRDDWQIKAVTKILSILFAANEMPSSDPDKTIVRHGIKMHTKYVPVSDFYIPILDLMNSADDFDAWENRSQQFCFCQYPFLFGMAAKKQIIEHDAKRQMAARARDAFFSRVLTSSNDATNEALERFFVLDVRRDCLVEDSFRGVSSAMTSGPNNLKKGLRIVFHGEEGLDYGGPRKEWFLQLVRELFNPDHGLFVYDEDSHFCYFNPYSLEHSDTYFLVGIVLGLAIYNSTILDVALPPFAFRKLMAAAPNPSRVGNPGGAPTPSVAHRWAPMTYSLADLAEYRPRLAIGLQALLDYEGSDVEDVFCLDFTITIDRFGTPVVLPLCPGGASRSVTSANRHEYVSLYVRFVLDASVTRQFEPFCRGFYTVCAGSTALSLCQPEEVELLIRGSDEALDIDALRAVAVYENWRRRSDDLGSSASSRYRRVQPEEEPVVRWFWQTFAEASPQNQRKLLVFITGSDRIPAGGAASLVIKVTCLGDDVDRFPIARTCFNMLSLYRYRTKAMLEQKLWMAVHESEGFGLK